MFNRRDNDFSALRLVVDRIGANVEYAVRKMKGVEWARHYQENKMTSIPIIQQIKKILSKKVVKFVHPVPEDEQAAIERRVAIELEKSRQKFLEPAVVLLEEEQQQQEQDAKDADKNNGMARRVFLSNVDELADLMAALDGDTPAPAVVVEDEGHFLVGHRAQSVSTPAKRQMVSQKGNKQPPLPGSADGGLPWLSDVVANSDVDVRESKQWNMPNAHVVKLFRLQGPPPLKPKYPTTAQFTEVRRLRSHRVSCH
jgi:hypothetical protein